MRIIAISALMFLVPMTVATAAITGSYDNDGAGPDAGESVGQYETKGGLVPCSGPDCTFNDVVRLANRVINFLVQLLVVLGTIALVISGFKLVTSGGDQAAMESAKKMFTNVVIGLIIVLAAWLIIDTVLKMLTGGF
ncbi:MAG: pilin [Candidatus Paceibacterota bacterium]